MEAKKIFSAKEARDLADNTRAVANRIYKYIREAAKDGCTKMHWDIFQVSEVTINKLVCELREAGYAVDVRLEVVDTPDDDPVPVSLEIQW